MTCPGAQPGGDYPIVRGHRRHWLFQRCHPASQHPACSEWGAL